MRATPFPNPLASSWRHDGRALVVLLLVTLSLSQGTARAAEDHADTYDEASILHEAKAFFGEASEGLGKAVEKAFDDYGRPNGYIKGDEVSAALSLGINYGDGELTLKSGEHTKVYWQGPTLGFDIGVNAAKVFILVYNLPNKDAIFRRYPGVDGSLYVVAGVGMNYQQRGNTVLAPIRVGVGWRTGANVGYMHYTRSRHYFPL